MVLVLGLISIVALNGCRGPHELSDAAKEEIDPGATTIIIERGDPELVGSEAIALELFDDAITYFAANGFLIEGSNEETLTFTTEPTRVDDGLALRINGVVERTPGGSRLVVSAQHASTVGTPVGQWKEAAWTTPEAKRAFDAAFALTQEIPHTDSGVSVE